MFNNNNGYSLADIAAATRNNNDSGWGCGEGGWWIILLFFFAIFGGGWGNGWGNGGLFAANSSTGSGITDGYILTSDFANIERKIDSVNNGLCDGFYAMNTGMLNGFSGINTNLATQTAALQASATALSNQLAQCCCDSRYETASKFAELNYNLADQSCQTRRTIQDATRDIIMNQDNSTRAILDFMTQDKIATLTSENAALKAAASNAAQTYDIVNQLKPCPVPAYVVANPYCNCGNNFGYNI